MHKIRVTSCGTSQIGFPHTAVLGRLPGTNLYRNVKQYPEARTIPGILIARVDAPFYFASVHVSDATAWCSASQTLYERRFIQPLFTAWT